MVHLFQGWVSVVYGLPTICTKCYLVTGSQTKEQTKNFCVNEKNNRFLIQYTADRPFFPILNSFFLFFFSSGDSNQTFLFIGERRHCLQLNKTFGRLSTQDVPFGFQQLWLLDGITHL